VGSNTTLPILNNLLLKTEEGQLKISSTNLEIAIKTWVGAQIEKPGEITVPARTIVDYINNISEEKIMLETKMTDLLVKTPSTQSVVKGLPAEDFPLIPEIQDGIVTTVNAEILAGAVAQILFASSFSETQPELSGVLFELGEKKLTMAATDRYRLAEKIIDLKNGGGEKKAIVPNRAITELGRVLSGCKNDAEILISDNQILFKVNGVEIISRLIEGQYPDYKQIIPTDFPTQIKLGVKELTSALKLSGLFAQENNNVELDIIKNKDAVVIKATSQRAGSNTTEVRGVVEGEDNNIIFNYRYILDCLNHLHNKEVVLKVINSSSPAMVVPEGEDNYLYLVMPIKT